MTLVTAVIRDLASNVYSNALVEASYLSNIPVGTGSGPPLVSGSVFQTFSVSETDSFGNLSMGLTDLALITPTGGSWFFNVLNSTKTIGFSLNSFAITGASVDLTAAFAAASAPLLPASSFINVTINGSESFAEIAAPAGAAGFDRVYGDSTSHRLTVKNNNGPAATLATLSDNLGAFAATTSAQLAGVLSDETGTGLVVFGTGATISPKNLSNIRIASQFAGADGGAKINAADADLGATPGEIWVDQGVGLSWTTAVVISANHVLRFIQGGTYTSSASPMITLAGAAAAQGAQLNGDGPSTIIQTSSATADIIQMTGNACYAANFLARSSVIRTAGAGINCLGGGCFAENFELNLTWNGVQCNATTGAGIGCKNFLLRKGGATTGAWNSGILLGGQASGSSTSECFFVDGQIAAANGFPFADAGIVMDAGTDTIKFTNVDSVTSGGGGDSVCLKVRWSGGALDLPRISRFIGCSFESGVTTNTVEVTACKDLRLIGCQINAGLAGLLVGGANVNTFTFTEGGIAQSQRQNVSITAGGAFISVLNSNLNGASQAGNGSFDSILVAANTTNFWIDGNNFNDQFTYANHPNFNVNIAAGTSNHYGVVNNMPSLNAVSGFLSDNGSGGFKTTSPNDDATGVGTVINKTIFSGALASGPWTPAQITGNFSAGDLGCARSSTSGLMYFGTDANIALFRSGATLRLLKTGATVPQWQQDGLTTIYNLIATAGQGVPPIYGATSQKTESAADTNVLTFTPPAAVGTYRLSFVLSLSAANAATLGWTATWTDSNGAAQTPTNLALSQTGVAAPALTFTTSAVANYYGSVVIDTNAAAVNIVIKLTFAGTSFTGKASATIERLI